MTKLVDNYSFSTIAKTVTLTSFSSIRLDRLRLITDVTTNQILYNFADSSVATATVATNVITLSALPGGVASGDKLQVDYDLLAGDPVQAPMTIGMKNSSGNLAPLLTVGAEGVSGGGSNGLIAIGGYTYNGATFDAMAYAGIGGSLAVGGATAAGNNMTGATNPVIVGGSDYAGTPKAQQIKVDASGGLYVNLAGTQNINVNSINGVTPLMNNGVSGTGSQRINIASDNSAIANWGHGATGSAVPSGATLLGINDNGTSMTYLYSARSTGDNYSGGQMLPVGTMSYSGSTWDKLRVPNTFKSAQATASGDTAVWTPTTGKKFRIMRFKIMVTGNATQSSAGVITVKLRDGTTDLNVTHDVYVPSSAITSQFCYDSGWLDLGNGALSAAANNVLNANLSAALTAGNVRTIVAGTEE